MGKLLRRRGHGGFGAIIVSAMFVLYGNIRSDHFMCIKTGTLRTHMSIDTCAYAIIKVGKVKSSAKLAHPRLLGRQVLARYASFVAARWLHQMEG